MEYRTNQQLKDYNSFKTEAIAKKFCSPQTVVELQKCLQDNPQERKLVIGEGCNLFFTQNFDGLVIHPNIKGLREAWDDDEDFEEEQEVYIEVNASENWDEFVAYCVEKGFAGVENLSLIPGTVGASPVQNIGAYGAEVKDVIREVVALDINTGEVVSFNNAECEFGYRDSIFKQTQKYVIVSVVFHLQKEFSYVPKYMDLNNELENIESPTLQDVRDAVIRIRQRKLPDEKVLPNAGSFFKNPCISKEMSDTLVAQYPTMPAFPQRDGTVKTSAAFLVDQSGYKGKRIGNVGTYPNQPLIVVNYGTSDGNEIVKFMKEIQAVVLEKFGIELEPEVRIF